MPSCSCLLPLVIWMFDTSLSVGISFAFKRLPTGLGFCLPGWFIKLVAGPDLGLPAPLHGRLRHLWMDIFHGLWQRKGRKIRRSTPGAISLA